MNNYINYYYNIYPDSIREQNKTYYFTYNNEIYYFLIFNRPLEDTNYLYELNLEMIRRGSLVHEIILTKDKSVLTMVNDIPYVLMRVYVNETKKSDLSEITFINMSNANIKNNKILDRSDWVTLWSIKVDYFEYQISQIGKKYPLICEYLSYYIGLAENAISYVKNTIMEEKITPYDSLTIVHKRIKPNDTAFDIYNPLSLIIDYQVRDLGEYIKAKFFDGSDIWSEIDNYFKNYDLSMYSRRLLYARLLFPSYFFDVYEAIVEGNLKESDILSIVYKAEQYETFLVEFHSYINRSNLLPSIDWLNKKNSINYS
jgi:spore coat protein YutH